MNAHNSKLDDVTKAFAAIGSTGRDTEFSGKIKANIDLNSHIQGIAPYRSYHVLTHSDAGEPSGRLLTLNRTSGKEALKSTFMLPPISQAKPYYFHPGGCQVIGDCLAVPIETGTGSSAVCFFDISDPTDIHEVNPAARIRRYRDGGALGITNFAVSGKDHWLLCVYDNGATDFYISDDSAFPGQFKVVFSLTFDDTDFQSLCLLTDAADQVFAVGLRRSVLGKDMATLFSVDLQRGKVAVVSERRFKTTGPDDIIGGGPHFRWGAGVEIVSATSLALFCTGRRFDDGCHINQFDSTKAAVRRVKRSTPGTIGRRAKRPALRKRR